MLSGEAVIDARLTPISSISGTLTGDSGLAGHITVEDGIEGDTSTEEIHLDAALTPVQKIGGILQGLDSIIGTITMGGCGIEEYDGAYEIIPRNHTDQVLDTKGKKMKRDVTVFKVPYWRTSNESGMTVYIGVD